ncbi:MAG: alpha/beta fold hydrolase [Actinophytocola sp.]|uniref:alpha/beta hydrolase n=1 Tax=Actinophytocola sp. TaxID=1872138 RepID=UPI0013222590|nr:alpha/beta hydrolase [Actinophytocola sp.]MPZ83808.1 alpha/beta fold hydrolase [Actinophytocola sp.]
MRARLLMIVAVLVVAGMFSSSGVGVPPEVGASSEAGPWYYRQQLAWGSCAGDVFFVRSAECARLAVPLDYAKPDGARVSLGVLRHRVERADRRIGALVVSPDGPGDSGMSLAAGVAYQLAAEPLRDRFDLVGFDARGVGASRPLVACLPDQALDALRALPAEPTAEPTVDSSAEVVAVGELLADGCAKDTELLSHVGTRETVRDLDVLRAALGEEKLSYFGRSYGTRVGAAYASAFPGRVRAMVLDGSVHPTAPPVEQLRAQLTALTAAFTAYATSCARRPDCPVGTDPAVAARELDDLLARAPYPVGDRELSTRDIAYLVTSQLYNSSSWPVLSQLLADLEHGDAGKLLELADRILDRQADGSYAAGGLDVRLAVDCVDGEFPADPVATLTDLRTSAGPGGTWRLPAVDVEALVCPHWLVPPVAEPITGAPDPPPVLVMATTGDAATPYANGVAMAERLGADLVTYEGYRHTVYLASDDCVNRTGHDYLVSLRTPPEHTRCPGL